MILNDTNGQISFASYEPDEEDIVDPKKHYAELVADVKSMMKKIVKAPNENFPDFIWSPVQNDFSDEFHKDNHQYISLGLGLIKIENGGEIMDSVKKLKNRYKDYFEYLDAVAVWDRYYDFIEETYGSFEMFGQMVESDMTAVPFKRRPKLKNAKKNRHLLEINVPISRIIPEDAMSDEDQAEIASQMPDQIEVYEDYLEYINFLYKANKKQEFKMQRDNRIRNLRKKSSVSGSSEMSAIIDYLSDGNSAVTNFGASNLNKPLCDDIEAFHEYDGLNDDLKADAMGLRRGKIYTDPNYQIIVESGQTQDDVDVYSALYAAGFEVGAMLNKSNMKREAVKMITRSIGMEENISEKKMKKLKKKRAKKERKLYETLQSNEEVRSILTKNRVSFDPSESMISFTLKDVLREGGGI